MKKVAKVAFQKGLVNRQRGKFHSKFKIGDKVMFMGNSGVVLAVRFALKSTNYDLLMGADSTPIYNVDGKTVCKAK